MVKSRHSPLLFGGQDGKVNLDLEDLLGLVAKSLKLIDDLDSEARSNQRTGMRYHPGLPSMSESTVTKLIPQVMHTVTGRDDIGFLLEAEVKYPNTLRAKCDLVLRASRSLNEPLWAIDKPLWAIEVKAPSLIGDNGKNNDFNVQKMLSPYLKDRSLLHDIERLGADPFAHRLAVIGYMFTYSQESCEVALQMHPNQVERVREIRKVIERNDERGGRLDAMSLIHAADRLLQYDGLVGPLKFQMVDGLWRHPCGGTCVVFGWEVNVGARSK